jgi:hypothetical protein
MTIQVLENNTLVLPNDVEVGDIKQLVFYPQIKIKPWNNECNFSMRLAGSGITWDMVDDKVVWTSEDGKVEAGFYFIDDEVMENGVYEFDITLKEKPASNVLTFTLKHKGLTFYYQDVLTQEEVDSGAERPVNVIGSYAVYHKSKRHNDYKTGKAFHIFRPFATDYEDNTVWCDLFIDPENEIATITLPEEFYNNAVYPIYIDPTIGYTGAGSTLIGSNGNVVRGMFYWNESIYGTINYLSYSCRSNSGTKYFKGFIWKLDADTNPIVTNGIGGATSMTTTKAWRNSTFNTAPKLRPGVVYCYGIMGDANQVLSYYDSGSKHGVWSNTNNYANPTGLEVLGGAPGLFGMYLNYTATDLHDAPTDKKLYFSKKTIDQAELPSDDYFEGVSLDPKWTTFRATATVSGSQLIFYYSGEGGFCRVSQNKSHEFRYYTPWEIEAKITFLLPNDIDNTDPPELQIFKGAPEIGNILSLGIKVEEGTLNRVLNIRYNSTNHYFPTCSGWNDGDPMYLKVRAGHGKAYFYSSLNGSDWEEHVPDDPYSPFDEGESTACGVALFNGQNMEANTSSGVVDYFVFRDLATHQAMIWTTSSGMDNYMPVTYSGSDVGYVQLSTDTDNQASTLMRVRKDGTTYAIMADHQYYYD